MSSGQDKGTGEVLNPGKKSGLILKFHPHLAAAVLSSFLPDYFLAKTMF